MKYNRKFGSVVKGAIVAGSLTACLPAFGMAAEPAADAASNPQTPPSPLPQQEKVVLVRVNGGEITTQDFVEHMQRNAAHIGAAINSSEARIATIRQMVGSQLIKQQLEKEGLLNDKQSQAETSAALQKFAAKNFPPPATPDEKKAYQYYLDHQSEFGIPEMVRVSQIQFQVAETATDAQKAEIKQKAENALNRLTAGEPFAKLAVELTENPLGKIPQGDLGYLSPASDPWLKKSLEGIKVGQHTGVIESAAGYEILMVTDVRPAVISPYPNARDKVLKRVSAAEQQELRDKYIATLAKDAKIEILEPNIQKLFPKGIFPN